MFRTFSIIVGVLVIGLFLYTLLAPQSTNEPAKDQQSSEQTTETDDSSTTTRKFTSEQYVGVQFSLDLPAAVSRDQVQENIYEFKYVGPNAEPNTEITDGYYLSVQIISTSTDLRRYVDAVAIPDTVAPTVVAERDGFAFDTTSQLNNRTVNHLALAPVKEVIVDIAYSVYGDGAGAYQEAVSDIIQSLSFTATDEQLSDLIRVDTPDENATITSPLTISGEARGYWFFEADFPVVLTDWDGRIIAEHYATADGSWMTEAFVPFTSSLEFESPYTEDDPEFMSRGFLILQRANPSGLPENDNAIEIPIRFAPAISN